MIEVPIAVKRGICPTSARYFAIVASLAASSSGVSAKAASTSGAPSHVPIGIIRAFVPASRGESASSLSVAGSNAIVAPAACAVVSAVAYLQSAVGSSIDGVTTTLRSFSSNGVSSTLFHSSESMFAVASLPVS